MRTRFFNGVIATVFGLCAFAAPSQAVTLGFTTSITGGTFGLSSAGAGTFSLSSLSGVLFTSLSVNGDAISGDNGNYALTDGGAVTANCTSASGATLQLSGNVITLYGAVTGLAGLSSGCNALVTFTKSGWTGTASGTSGTTGSVSLNQATSEGENATLLTDLNLAAGTAPSNLLAGSAVGGTGSGNGNFTANSEQATFSLTQAPEPFSFFLVGAGLVTIYIARKRSAAVN
jgi:hypothetical protein